MTAAKMLSIGLPPIGGPFEHHNFGSAPSISDYDAVVVDMHAVSSFIGEVIGPHTHRNASNVPITNSGTRNVPGQMSLAELVILRYTEARQLIKNGGLLICFAYPPVYQRVRPLDDWYIFDWLPPQDATLYLPESMVPGDGEIGEIDTSRPFAQFFQAFKDELRYKVYFTAGAIEASQSAVPLAWSRGGQAVGIELSPFPDEPGKIIILPPVNELALTEPERVASVIQDCIAKSLGSVDSEPNWTELISLPGLEALDADVDGIRLELTNITERLRQSEACRDELASLRRILWTAGPSQLTPLVTKSLEMFGFETSNDAENIIGLYEGGEKVSIVAIEGTAGQIDVDTYRGLLNQVQDELEQSGNLLKGILIGNGYRLELPSNRGDQFSESCRRGALSQGFSLMTTSELFGAVHAVLEDSSEDLRSQIRRRVQNTTRDITFEFLRTT